MSGSLISGGLSITKYLLIHAYSVAQVAALASPGVWPIWTLPGGVSSHTVRFLCDQVPVVSIPCRTRSGECRIPILLAGRFEMYPSGPNYRVRFFPFPYTLSSSHRPSTPASGGQPQVPPPFLGFHANLPPTASFCAHASLSLRLCSC